MLQLRRYVVYFGLAACILITLNFYRNALLDQARARLDGIQDSGTAPGTSTQFSWDRVPTRFPLKTLTPLPTAKPRQLPNIQYQFSPESTQQKTERKQRQAKVKAAFERSWKAYKDYAWMHDELAPLSSGFKDTFGGWGATLVDSLDVLWIMGLKSEFNAAVEAATQIDLSKIAIPTVNVFETTIRHLGGFLSAYDLSGDKRCLAKAKEFGEMLMVAFDTPNRMPITRWDPRKAFEGPQEADAAVLVAEIGSLSMEFTRLSQLTGDPKWYDAIDRITRLLADQQHNTQLPGMWPVVVDGKHADFTRDSLYTLSAMADSLYEYLPKMYALLGGAESVYKTMYDGSMSTAINHLLFRPMTPDNADILLSGNVRTHRSEPPQLDAQGQHLTCFAGGMFALGGKLFDEPAHVEIGKRLTDGCIWTYKTMPIGIMPEVFRMLPCEDKLQCTWNQTAWQAMITSMESIVLVDAGRQPPGFTELVDRRYVLRPEAIESVFILYRITGERYLLDAAWDMFNSIMDATQTDIANAVVADITAPQGEGMRMQMDSMESFWLAETLKYFYLIFSEPSVIDLDQWVLNTEAHPFKRP